MSKIKAEDIVTGAIVRYSGEEVDTGILAYDLGKGYFGCHWFVVENEDRRNYVPEHLAQDSLVSLQKEFSAKGWAEDDLLLEVISPAKNIDELNMYKMLYPGYDNVFDLVYKDLF